MKTSVRLLLLLFSTSNLFAQSGSWQEEYSFPGLTGIVRNMEVKDNDIYVTGELFLPLTSERCIVAKYDGTNWSRVGPDDQINNFGGFSLKWVADSLFVHGNVGMYKLHNDEWHQVTMQLQSGQVVNLSGDESFGMHYENNRLHIYGLIRIHGTPMRHHVYWDGKQFSSMGAGLNGPVYGLSGSGGNLFLAGNFTATEDNAITLRKIARWDGFNYSEPFFVPNNSFPRDILRVVPNSSNSLEAPTVVVSGMTAISDGTLTHNTGLAFFSQGQLFPTINPETHQPINFSLMNQRARLAIVGDTMYVVSNDEIVSYSFAKGANTSVMGPFGRKTIMNVASNGSKVFALGAISYSFVNNISGPFFSLDTQTRLFEDYKTGSTHGIAGTVTSMVQWNNETYLFGDFIYSDLSKNIANAAKIGATVWQSIGSNLPRNLKAFAFDDGIYVGGFFSNAGPINNLSNLAKYDGNEWSNPLGEQTVNGVVNDIKRVGNRTFYIGNFNQVGGSPLLGAFYTTTGSTAINPLGINSLQGNVNFNHILVEQIDDDGFMDYRYFLSGGFQGLNGNTNLNTIAYWNGDTWSNIGATFTNSVLGTARIKNKLYLAQTFGSLQLEDGTQQSFRFFEREGSTWQRVVRDNSFIQSFIRGFRETDNGIYMFIDGDAPFNPFSRVGFFDGDNFHPLFEGNLPPTVVNDVIVTPDSLIIAIQGVNAYGSGINVYKYDTSVSIEQQQEKPLEFELGQNYPNPFNPTTTIPFTISQPAVVNLVVYTYLGQKVATLVQNQHFNSGQHNIQFEASKLSSGLYFYQLKAGTNVQTKKMLLVK